MIPLFSQEGKPGFLLAGTPGHEAYQGTRLQSPLVAAQGGKALLSRLVALGDEVWRPLC